MSDAALVFDQRAALAAEPGVHALLIGVSDYANLSSPDDPPGPGLRALQKLDFAARSAFDLRRKLEQLDAAGRLSRKLKTIRLLTAPSAVEIAAEPDLATQGGVIPTRDAIKDALWRWRQDAGQSTDEVALLYFAGHGIRRAPEESILLAADFLEPMNADLDRAFRLSEVYNGMAPSAMLPNMSLNQFYFVDACRDKPAALDTMDDTATPKIWQADLNTPDNRSAPIFFSTLSGNVAAGESGKTTYFLEALLWALEHGSYRREVIDGARKAWPIRPKSLHDGLRCYSEVFAPRFELTGKIGMGVLAFAQDPPSLTLRIQIDPAAVLPTVADVTLKTLDGATLIAVPAAAQPCAVPDIDAGLYQLKLRVNGAQPEDYLSEVELINVGLTMPWMHVLP